MLRAGTAMLTPGFTYWITTLAASVRPRVSVANRPATDGATKRSWLNENARMPPCECQSFGGRGIVCEHVLSAQPVIDVKVFKSRSFETTPTMTRAVSMTQGSYPCEPVGTL